MLLTDVYLAIFSLSAYIWRSTTKKKNRQVEWSPAQVIWDVYVKSTQKKDDVNMTILLCTVLYIYALVTNDD